MVPLYRIRWEEARKKCFPSCYAKYVLVSRRVQMFIEKQKNPMFCLPSCSKVNKLKCYIGTTLNNNSLSFETA